MPDIVTRVGGRTIPLRRKSSEFDVLRPKPELLAGLLGLGRIRGVRRLGYGKWRIELNGSAPLEFLMADVRQASIAHHAYETDDELPLPFVPTDIVNIKFAAGTSEMTRLALVADNHLQVVRSLGPHLTAFRLTDQTGMN